MKRSIFEAAWFHARRVTGRHCDHRDPCRIAAARDSSRSRGGSAFAVRQQRQAAWRCPAQLSRYARGVSDRRDREYAECRHDTPRKHVLDAAASAIHGTIRLVRPTASVHGDSGLVEFSQRTHEFGGSATDMSFRSRGSQDRRRSWNGGSATRLQRWVLRELPAVSRQRTGDRGECDGVEWDVLLPFQNPDGLGHGRYRQYGDGGRNHHAAGKRRPAGLAGRYYRAEHLSSLFSTNLSPNTTAADYGRTCEAGSPSFARCTGSVDPQYFFSRSFHPGGVQVVLADASVRFVPDTINTQVWRDLGTRSGQEPPTAF